MHLKEAYQPEIPVGNNQTRKNKLCRFKVRSMLQLDIEHFGRWFS